MKRLPMLSHAVRFNRRQSRHLSRPSRGKVNSHLRSMTRAFSPPAITSIGACTLKPVLGPTTDWSSRTHAREETAPVVAMPFSGVSRRALPSVGASDPFELFRHVQLRIVGLLGALPDFFPSTSAGLLRGEVPLPPMVIPVVGIQFLDMSLHLSR